MIKRLVSGLFLLLYLFVSEAFAQRTIRAEGSVGSSGRMGQTGETGHISE
jgi:hypothetical protein